MISFQGMSERPTFNTINQQPLEDETVIVKEGQRKWHGGTHTAGERDGKAATEVTGIWGEKRRNQCCGSDTAFRFFLFSPSLVCFCSRRVIAVIQPRCVKLKL